MAIFSFLLLVLMASYSHERYLSDWSINTDPSLIDECLRKSFQYIDFGSGTRPKTLDAVNVVCKTQILNGIHIELTFDVHGQTWKCSLYKSLVTVLSVQYETCDKVLKEDSPNQKPQSNDEVTNSEDADEEARIDALNMRNKENDEQENKVDQTDEQLRDGERNGNKVIPADNSKEEQGDGTKNDEKTNEKQSKLDSKGQLNANDDEDNQKILPENIDNRAAAGADNDKEEDNPGVPRANINAEIDE